MQLFRFAIHAVVFIHLMAKPGQVYIKLYMYIRALAVGTTVIKCKHVGTF